MEEYVSGALQPAAQQAYRLRPLVLKVFAEQYDKHADGMPHGIVAVVDIVSCFLCGESFYLLSEQLHLGEFAALEMKKQNAALDMDILVRQKPFREESQSGFLNDVDLDGEQQEKPDLFRSEFLGGMGESECEEEEDTEGDLTVRRQAYTKFSLDECKAMLQRDREVHRRPGRLLGQP